MFMSYGSLSMVENFRQKRQRVLRQQLRVEENIIKQRNSVNVTLKQIEDKQHASNERRNAFNNTLAQDRINKARA